MSEYTKEENIAREYYNSEDADTFYGTIWGGEDIHIGIYLHPGDCIKEASRRHGEHLIAQFPYLDNTTPVLDLGSGYGGTARMIAKLIGCPVYCVNISEKENERNRQLNEEQGLSDLVHVYDASFEEIPFNSQQFKVVYSQDALLHSGNRTRVIEEVARVLDLGGHFVFTDIMQSDKAKDEDLQAIKERIHLRTLGSRGFYRKTAATFSLMEYQYIDYSYHLVKHYSRILEETEKHEAELKKNISESYLTTMKEGLRHWIRGGELCHIVWGMFVFLK